MGKWHDQICISERSLCLEAGSPAEVVTEETQGEKSVMWEVRSSCMPATHRILPRQSRVQRNVPGCHSPSCGLGNVGISDSGSNGYPTEWTPGWRIQRGDFRKPGGQRHHLEQGYHVQQKLPQWFVLPLPSKPQSDPELRPDGVMWLPQSGLICFNIYPYSFNGVEIEKTDFQ